MPFFFCLDVIAQGVLSNYYTTDSEFLSSPRKQVIAVVHTAMKRKQPLLTETTSQTTHHSYS